MQTESKRSRQSACGRFAYRENRELPRRPSAETPTSSYCQFLGRAHLTPRDTEPGIKPPGKTGGVRVIEHSLTGMNACLQMSTNAMPIRRCLIS